MAKMSMLARQYIWWPNLDQDSKDYVQNCNACMSTVKAPPKLPLIKFREALYERVHIDLSGLSHRNNSLIIIDAYSKWWEIFEMSETDSTSTIRELRECFATFGLPQIIFFGQWLTLYVWRRVCEVLRTDRHSSPGANATSSVDKRTSRKHDRYFWTKHYENYERMR